MLVNSKTSLNISDIEKCVGLFSFGLDLADGVLDGGRAAVVDAVWVHVDEGADEAGIEGVLGHPDSGLGF